MYIPLHLRVEILHIKVNTFNLSPNIGILERIRKTVTGKSGLKIKIQHA